MPARPGMYVSPSDRSTDIPCPAGTYSSEEASTSCTECPRGTYSEIGAAACTKCPKGTFGASKKAVMCSECPEGSFSFKEGRIFCDLCLPGSYSNDRNTSVCTICPPSKFTKSFVRHRTCDERTGVLTFVSRAQLPAKTVHRGTPKPEKDSLCVIPVLLEHTARPRWLNVPPVSLGLLHLNQGL